MSLNSRRSTGPEVVTVNFPGGVVGTVRKKVRFEDEPTTVEVTGDDSPAVYTSVAGVQSLVVALRAAVQYLSTRGVREGVETQWGTHSELICVFGELREKCGIRYICGARCSAAAMADAFRRIEQGLVNAGGDPVLRGIWWVYMSFSQRTPANEREGAQPAGSTDNSVGGEREAE